MIQNLRKRTVLFDCRSYTRGDGQFAEAGHRNAKIAKTNPKATHNRKFAKTNSLAAAWAENGVCYNGGRRTAITLTFDIPPETEATKKERLAVALYDAHMVSQGRAAQIAGLSRDAFIDALGRYGVTPFQYDADEVLAELEMLRERDERRQAAAQQAQAA